MIKITYIYSLVDPISHEIRYIGKTVDPAKRLARHIRDGYTKRSHKGCWIYGLLQKGLRPKMVILEECLCDDWIEMEKYYIRILPNLTNHTEGGDSPGGHRMSEEAKMKMSESKKGSKNPFFGKTHTNKSRKSVSEGLKKYFKNNDPTFLGKPHSEDSRKKMSLKAKERADRGEIPKLPVMSGKDNPASIMRIFISPLGEKFTVYNIKKFCEENDLSYKIIFRNINKGPIQKPSDKKTLDRQRRRSLNTIGWEVIQ